MEGNLIPVLFVILAAAFLAIFFYLFCAEFRHTKMKRGTMKNEYQKNKNVSVFGDRFEKN